MDIRQFRYFQIAARTESLTKAAEIIHISQPALSRIIQRLEADLGFQLFFRTANRSVLTAEGVEFLKTIDQCLEMLDNVICRCATHKKINELSVGFTYSDIGMLAIKPFCNAHPDMKIRQLILPPDSLQSRLTTSYLDLVISPDVFHDDMLCYVPLYSEELLAFLPTNHPLYGTSEIAVDALSRLPLLVNDIVFDRPSLIRLFEKHARAPQIQLETNDRIDLSEYALNGRYAMMVPCSMVSKAAFAKCPGAYLRIRSDLFRREIGYVYLRTKGLSVVATEFVNFYTACVQGMDCIGDISFYL